MITVEDILRMPVFKQARVRTALETISCCPVKFISVIERPVEDFIRKNELVLSTAMGCNEDPQLFTEFVREIFASGAAALVIAMGGHVTTIPDEVLQFSEQVQFPVIEIPWQVRFSEITEAVLIKLHNWKQLHDSKDDFVWNLAAGPLDSWEAVNRQADSMGYNLNLPYVCIVGTLNDMEAVYQRNSNANVGYEVWHSDTIHTIKEQASWAGKSLGNSVMTAYQQDRLIIFLEVAHLPAAPGIHSFLDRTEERMAELLPEAKISWGIADNHIGVKAFHDSFKQASLALEAGQQQAPGYRSTYQNTILYRLLLPLLNSSETADIVMSVIGVLIEYDEQRGLNLMETLTTYMQHRGNVSQTARALHLHRQSLLYRLTKIESLCNRSLENPDDLFLLDLCIRLWTAGVQHR